jgi:predicted PurR-regulated permease PerM
MATHSLEEGKPPERLFVTFFSNFFLFGLLFVVLWGCYALLKPYLSTVVLAAILAVLFSPVHRRIERRIGSRKNAAAFLSCVALTLLVVLPLLIIVLLVIQQGIESFKAIQAWADAGHFDTLANRPFGKYVADLTDLIYKEVSPIVPGLEKSELKIGQWLTQVSKQIGGYLLSQSGSIIGNVTSLVANFFLMLFVFFFLVRDGDRIVSFILHLSPLSHSREEEILRKIKEVAQSAVLGTILTALVQAIAGGIAFFIVGLPGLFWGMMVGFASLVPVVGTGLVLVPATGYLLISGQYGYAIFFAAWGVIVVGSVDNLLRPILMRGAADMSTLLLLLAIIGGISYFGLIGLLFGPLIFGLATVLLYIYGMEFGHFLDRQDNL